MRATLKACGASAAALFLALLLRWLAMPLLDHTLPFITVFAAVAASVWLGGRWPAAATALAGYVLATHLFAAPPLRPGAGTLASWTTLFAYSLTAVIIIGFGEALRRERRRAALRSESLRTTLESIGDAVIATDDQGRIAIINPVAEVLTGWHAGSALGEPVGAVFRLASEHDGTLLADTARQAVELGRAVGPTKPAVLIGRDGRRVPVEEQAAPLRNGAGEIVGAVLVFRDISARRAEEVRLRESREQLHRALAEAATPTLLFVDSGQVLLANRAWIASSRWRAEQIGTLDEWMRLTGSAIDVPPEASGARIDLGEHAVLTGEGTTRLWQLTVTPIGHDAQGRRLFVATAIDLTELRHTDTSLRDSLRRLRMALDAAHMVAWEYDAASNHFHASGDLGELFGAAPGERIDFSQRAQRFVHPADREAYRAAVKSALERRDGYVQQFRVVRPDDGRVVWMEEQARAFDTDDGRTLLAGVVIDISERKRDALMLAHQKRVLEMVATGSPVGEVLTALAATIEAQDPSLLCTVLLVDPDQHRLMRGAGQLIDGYVSTLEGTSFDAPHANPCAFSADTGAEAVVMDVESDRRWPQRWRRQALLNGLRACRTIPVRLADGSIAAVLALYRREAGGDLTADSRLVRVTMNLLSIIVERRRFEQSLHEANQRKDEFLAALAHELRNPLAPIRHAVAMLQRPDFDAARLPHTTALLDRQVKQLVRLVDDLLDINRVSRGRILLRLSQVRLNDVVTQAVETVMAMHPERARDLELVLPDAPITLRADHARLLQVLGNLLANAFKFSDAGSRVRVAAGQEGHEAVIRVRDQGIGIAPHELRRIFGLFVQVDGSKERSPAGLGIGLALAQRLVQLHDGRLSAHSAGPGRGSEFIVHLPLAASATTLEPPPATPPVRPEATTMRVLVVDDNVDAAESLAALLRLVGHRIELAHDGVEALERAERWQPDAVLLDLGLPRLSGLEVSQRIRAQPWGRGMRLVALTGWGQDLDRQRTRESGIDAHLVKPVELEALLAALQADTAVV